MTPRPPRSRRLEPGPRGAVRAPRAGWLGPALRGGGVLLLLSSLAGAQTGGIEVFAAEPLFAGGTRVSWTHIAEVQGSLHRGSDSVADPLDRTLVKQRVVLGLDRGIRPNLAVSVLVPFVATELDTNGGDLDAAGVGDVALIGKYRFHRRDWRQGTFNVALIGGIELPTGETGARDGGMRLPPNLQPGSGAWNPFLALSSNVSAGRFRCDGNLFYKLNTEGAQDFEKGDFFAAAVDAKYRFLFERYPGPTAAVKLGLQYRHEERARRAAALLADSGSDEVRLRSGLSWHPAPNLDVSLSVEIPVFGDFNGEQLAVDYRTFLALGLRF